MPATKVQLLKSENGKIPVKEWLNRLKKSEPTAYAACLDSILQLEKWGHELRRPAAAFLRNGIYELRIKERRIHYRILYFFYGKNCAMLFDAISAKKGKVNESKIKLGVKYLRLVEQSPNAYIATFTTQ